MKIRKLQPAIMAAVLAGAMSASAVTLTFNGVSPNEIVDLTVSSPSFSGGVYAGIYNQTVDGVATPSFCIDVARQISAGQTLNDYSYTDLALAQRLLLYRPCTCSADSRWSHGLCCRNRYRETM